MKQGTQSQCSGTTQKDGVGREVEVEFRRGVHMYTCDWFMFMYGKTHHNIVIILQLNSFFNPPQKITMLLKKKRQWNKDVQISEISSNF